MTIDPRDLLEGNGIFNTSSQLDSWVVINASAYTYQVNTEGAYLELSKSGDGNYDDGLYYYFGKHGQDSTLQVSAMVSTNNPDVESCDIRLTQVERNQSENSTFKRSHGVTPSSTGWATSSIKN